MPDEPNNPEEHGFDAPEPDGDAPAIDNPPPVDPVERVRRGWREFWQVPALVVAAGVLMLGVAVTVGNAPEPEFESFIRRAERLIEREDYTEAIGLLNNKVYPWLNEPGVFTPQQIQRYHLGKARAIYYGQKMLEIDDDRNHVSVIREYLSSEREGATLEPRDLAALADSYISRSEIDAGLIRLRAIPASGSAVRDPIVRRAVRELLRPPAPSRDKAFTLLAEILADPGTGLDQRVWALERQANLRLEDGYLDETITQLLREMPRIAGAESAARARLHLLLARAYRMSGADDQASTQVGFAEQISVPGDPHFASVMLERARLLQRAGNASGARDLYSIITERHADSEAYPWALVGLGETEAVLGEHGLSIEAYQALIENYDALEIRDEPTRAQVMESLQERAGELLSQNEPGLAIRFGRLAERVIGAGNEPTSLLNLMAMSHSALAEELAAGSTTKVDPLVGLDPSTRAEVQRELLSAATYRRLYADRHLLTDIGRYADALWEAGDLFDRAGDQREAIQTFKLYVETLPSDPRHAEARFRMGESLRAVGDFAAAAEVYQGLIADREGTSGVDIGAWSDASHVPLAQAYLYDEDPGNDAEAERLLMRAISGSFAGTQTQLFRDALVELAMLYERTDRPARAIERLEEVVDRFPKDHAAGLMTYRLGEANRRLALEIEETLDDSIPPASRAERRSQVLAHREEAIGRYREAIASIGAKRPVDRTRIEDLALRNAHFYTGDVLSDLERYDEAIRAYDLARDRYPNEAATLVALIQIVNAHMARGDLLRARTANERARRFFMALPDEAWDDPSLPMDRADWESWLSASSQLLAEATTDGS